MQDSSHLVLLADPWKGSDAKLADWCTGDDLAW